MLTFAQFYLSVMCTFAQLGLALWMISVPVCACDATVARVLCLWSGLAPSLWTAHTCVQVYNTLNCTHNTLSRYPTWYYGELQCAIKQNYVNITIYIIGSDQ